MSALEDWYGRGCVDEDEPELEEEQLYFECLDAKIDELVRERMAQQSCYLTPLQLMSQINESLSKNLDLFGKIINLQGVFKYGCGVESNGYYYDNITDENNSTHLKIIVPAHERKKIKNDSRVLVSGMVTKCLDAAYGSIELQFRVDSITEILTPNHKIRCDRLDVKDDSSFDKEQIKKLLAEKQKYKTNYAKLQRNLKALVQKDQMAKKKTASMALQLVIWQIVAAIGIILFVYMYGTTKLWW